MANRMMIRRETLALRDLERADIPLIRRIIDTSEYLHLRFAPEELPRLLDLYPAVGAFSVATGRTLTSAPAPAPMPPTELLARRVPAGIAGGFDDSGESGGVGGSLQAFLLANSVVPPCAWIGGFGLVWSEGERFAEYLDLLLPLLLRRLAARGVSALYYSGSDLEADWLHEPLEARGFMLASLLRSYDKTGYIIPTEGNQRVRVRPFMPADTGQLVALERLCFDDLWRHDAPAFLEVAQTYPYFVVAEDPDRPPESNIVGYQFNVVDAAIGYLVRIAVHPSAEGQGVGARLMAEAVRYFQRHQVAKIVLNTEETNTRAHRLYEWFGFYLTNPRGFALRREITR
ncbi:MAG: GNAT family N-acetyltransferase [Ktedonobacterales bacterium]